jgi:hypothetical protein
MRTALVALAIGCLGAIGGAIHFATYEDPRFWVVGVIIVGPPSFLVGLLSSLFPRFSLPYLIGTTTAFALASGAMGWNAAHSRWGGPPAGEPYDPWGGTIPWVFSGGLTGLVCSLVATSCRDEQGSQKS